MESHIWKMGDCGTSLIIFYLFNRSMGKNMKLRKRCSFRKHGGGLAMGASLVPFDPSVDTSFSAKVPIQASYSDCDIPARMGQLYTNPQVNLAQTVMAGGGCGCNMRVRGGSRRKHARRTRHRGGNRGFVMDPTMSVGATGPNVGALVNPIPCDPRSGFANPSNQTPGMPDTRAPSDLYSLTANQTGGSYGTGNGFSDACYRATGSSMPVYEAQTAGFGFQPSTVSGSSMPDGVTGYMTVVPQAARMGGSRRRNRRTRRTRRTRPM